MFFQARSISPIQQTPVEILGKIFYFASHVDSFGKLYKTPRRGISHAHSPLVLFRVCKEWRHIALATPELFTQLYIFDEGFSNISIIVPLWLKHSQKLPLEVYMEYTTLRNGTTSTAREIVFSKIREHLHRVTFLAVPIHDLPFLVPINADVHLPQLNRLELLPTSSHLILHRSFKMGNLFVPNVVTVVIGAANSFPYARLHLGNKLTRYSSLKPGNIHQITFFKLLAENPNLEECQICCAPPRVRSGIDKAWETLKKVYPSLLLPELRSMSIEWLLEYEAPSCILERLQTPNLEFLQIRSTSFLYAITDLFPSVTTGLYASHPYKLQNMTLDFGREDRGYINIGLKKFSALLVSILNLKKLTIRGGYLNKRVIRRLNGCYYKHICPSLVELRFELSILPVGEVIEMVKSRAIPSKVGEKQNLQQFSVVCVKWLDQNGYVMPHEPQHPMIQPMGFPKSPGPVGLQKLMQLSQKSFCRMSK